MRAIEISKGLNLPIAGKPIQQMDSQYGGGQNGNGPVLKLLAVNGPDYVGMKPQFHVEAGDTVKMGQVLFEDKKNPGVLFTSPGSGKIRAINRGEKRVFRSVIIELDGDGMKSVDFPKFAPEKLESLEEAEVRENLIQSGFWTAFRTRPFSQTPPIHSKPHSLFVTAIDTSPLAPDPVVVIQERWEDFQNGLKVLSPLCGKRLYLCVGENFPVKTVEKLWFLETVVFKGPHPAGLPGTHIHFLDPVSSQKTVWHIGYQDVIAIGQLFTTGQFPTERVIALAGPLVKKPRLIRTRLGVCMKEVLVEELTEQKIPRVISGNVLSGRTGEDNGLWGLGRFHNQISVIEEYSHRTFFEWLYPGLRIYSMTRTLLSSLLPVLKFRLNTATHGGHRAIFPVKQFEQLVPLDILPVFLFRALEMGDVEQSEALGCLELDEEDVSLCTFADPGKNDYGKMLRKMLTLIQKEG
ncbi:MAG: Na(+)-translocating NADH-quinone reductase subunit A [Planctomycetaceae bacterium]|jgi:Na+-transporting NADH:ubiquinone oxidoreductase subunit A|nr:Na(+)-translocating NADH-quinone reductase subunit A [Planctomycetaceae bacterium]